MRAWPVRPVTFTLVGTCNLAATRHVMKCSATRTSTLSVIRASLVRRDPPTTLVTEPRVVTLSVTTYCVKKIHTCTIIFACNVRQGANVQLVMMHSTEIQHVTLFVVEQTTVW